MCGHGVGMDVFKEFSLDEVLGFISLGDVALSEAVLVGGRVRLSDEGMRQCVVARNAYRWLVGTVERSGSVSRRDRRVRRALRLGAEVETRFLDSLGGIVRREALLEARGVSGSERQSVLDELLAEGFAGLLEGLSSFEVSSDKNVVSVVTGSVRTRLQTFRSCRQGVSVPRVWRQVASLAASVESDLAAEGVSVGEDTLRTLVLDKAVAQTVSNLPTACTALDEGEQYRLALAKLTKRGLVKVLRDEFGQARQSLQPQVSLDTHSYNGVDVPREGSSSFDGDAMVLFDGDVVSVLLHDLDPVMYSAVQQRLEGNGRGASSLRGVAETLGVERSFVSDALRVAHDRVVSPVAQFFMFVDPQDCPVSASNQMGLRDLVGV